ncbi:hypothetical protein LZC95_20440 [Pendulispora brunnea]|uniref:Uncharacterized protein n=1 Tax=Pendulispora brunnea TaxID=2905690 RepID=A0ABZ2KKX0_9BACT
MSLAQITGDFADAASINERLDAARRQFHLVSPVETSPSVIPDGCSVVFSAVHVQLEYDAFPHKEAENSYGLKRTALQRIGNAAGIDWDPRFTRRTDDASQPHYCSFSAFGKVKLFDGKEIPLYGSKEVDLRDGSELTRLILDSNTEGTGEEQLRDARIHSHSDCETKAMLRAIRTLGLRSGYSETELRLPFIVARLRWTGVTNDPELRRIFALRQMELMLRGSHVLYGDGPPPPFVSTSPLPVPPLSPSPGLHHPARTRETASVPAAPPSAPVPKGRTAAPSKFEPIIKFGDAQGTPFSEAKTIDLTWYAQALRRQIENPAKTRYRARNEDDLRAANEELRQRGAPMVGAQATTPSREDHHPAAGGSYANHRVR